MLNGIILLLNTVGRNASEPLVANIDHALESAQLFRTAACALSKPFIIRFFYARLPFFPAIWWS